ncbi:MAG: hypothetical protein JHC95_21180 [Solirubrobacteraceae bacterium]|nr:hypothetical protein [Solirubrobacteraceae bacterium]
MDYTAEIVFVAVMFLAHVVGAIALVANMLDERGWKGLLDWWPNDDDGPGDDPRDDGPSPDGANGGLPLPDSDPATVRLREPGRIGESKPRPARRPDHEPAREPAHR